MSNAKFDFANWVFDPPLEIHNVPMQAPQPVLEQDAQAMAVPPDGAVGEPGMLGAIAGTYVWGKQVNKEPSPAGMLELNLAAKPIDMFDPVLSMEYFKKFRKEGRYMEYRWASNMAKTHWQRDPFSPHYHWSEEDIEHILKDGAYVHKTKKVLVYQPMQFATFGCVGQAGCIEALEESAVQSDDFVRWLGNPTYVIYEGVEFV